MTDNLNFINYSKNFKRKNMTDKLTESFIQISSINALPSLSSSDLVIYSRVALDKATLGLSSNVFNEQRF